MTGMCPHAWVSMMFSKNPESSHLYLSEIQEAELSSNLICQEKKPGLELSMTWDTCNPSTLEAEEV